MEPHDPGLGVALEEIGEVELGDMAPQGHLSPSALLSGGGGGGWLPGGAGRWLHLTAGPGEGLLWLTLREEPAFSLLPMHMSHLGSCSSAEMESGGPDWA